MMIYLACPFSHRLGRIRAQRYRMATRFAKRLVAAGFTVFSPLTHAFPLRGGIGTLKWPKWKGLDLAVLKVCDKLVVLKMPGWAKSEGVKAEIAFARRLKKEVIFYEPNVPSLPRKR